MLRRGVTPTPEAPSSYSVQRCLRLNEKSAARNFQAWRRLLLRGKAAEEPLFVANGLDATREPGTV
jgi:hypothetical protein